MKEPRQVYISDEVFESLNKMLKNHDDTFSKVIERLLVDKEHQSLTINSQPVISESESKVSPQRAREDSYAFELQPPATNHPPVVSKSEPKVSPRQARAYSYTVMGKLHSVPPSRSAQFKAYSHIIQLIAHHAGDQFCRDFAQSDLLNKRCIAETKKDLCGNYSMESTNPTPITLNGKKFFICANCSEETRIQFIITACYLARLEYGKDVALHDGWNYPGKYGHKQKNSAEQWARDRNLL